MAVPTSTARPSLQLSWQDWLPYLEDSAASEADKRRLIETLWAIILAFVDLGWEIVPTDSSVDAIAAEPGGQNLDLTAVLRHAVVYSKQNQITESEEV